VTNAAFDVVSKTTSHAAVLKQWLGQHGAAPEATQNSMQMQSARR